MTSFTPHLNFTINTRWGSRREEPEQIAGRLGKFMDVLAPVHETLACWEIGKRKSFPYSSVRDDLATLLRRDVHRDEMGGLEPNSGYSIVASSTDARQYFVVIGSVGGIFPWPSWNRMSFATYPGTAPNFSILTYPLFKTAILAMIDCWQPLFCVARASSLYSETDEPGWYRRTWMTYIPPDYVGMIDLVGVPFSERTPDGGLLLSATEQMFDADNPAHMEGANAIAQATRPLNPLMPDQ